MENSDNAVPAAEKCDEDITTTSSLENLSPTAIARLAENVRTLSLIREDIERMAMHPTYGFLCGNPELTPSVTVDIEDSAKNRETPDEGSVRSISYEALVGLFNKKFEETNDARQSSGTRKTTFNFLSVRTFQYNDTICALWYWTAMALLLIVTIVVLVITTRLSVRNIFYTFT